MAPFLANVTTALVASAFAAIHPQSSILDTTSKHLGIRKTSGTIQPWREECLPYDVECYLEDFSKPGDVLGHDNSRPDKNYCTTQHGVNFWNLHPQAPDRKGLGRQGFTLDYEQSVVAAVETPTNDPYQSWVMAVQGKRMGGAPTAAFDLDYFYFWCTDDAGKLYDCMIGIWTEKLNGGMPHYREEFYDAAEGFPHIVMPSYNQDPAIWHNLRLLNVSTTAGWGPQRKQRIWLSKIQWRTRKYAEGLLSTNFTLPWYTAKCQ